MYGETKSEKELQKLADRVTQVTGVVLMVETYSPLRRGEKVRYGVATLGPGTFASMEVGDTLREFRPMVEYLRGMHDAVILQCRKEAGEVRVTSSYRAASLY